MAALLNLSIYGLQNHTRIAFGYSKHVGKSSLMQPKNLKIKSQNKPPPQFEFGEYMTMKIKQINKALDKAVLLKDPIILHEAMRYTLLAGGKRVFPMICIASCESVGGNESLAMPMACALEMMTAAAVILDDLPCMDNDHLRRGKPTNHKVFGEAMSILVCHALVCHGIEHFTTKTKNVSSDRLLHALKEICLAIGPEGAIAGQIADKNAEGKEVSLKELEFIHMLKSGKIIEASAVCGALVGGGNEDEIERLRKYGKKVGLAYQVWDDILDVSGSVELLGKKVGGDLLRDKATYPKLIGIEESKKFARHLVAQANEELACFDSTRVAPLYHIANNIVDQFLYTSRVI